MKIIGVTGGSGTGKTTFCEFLEALGAKSIDADIVYYNLLESCPALITEIRDNFSAEIFDEAGRLDRKSLGRIVFADKSSLRLLNSIAIPYVRQEIDRLIAQMPAELPLLVINAPTLYESGADTLCEKVFALVADADFRLKRICARDGVNELYAALRINAQPGDNFYVNCGAVLIENHGDLEALKQKAGDIYHELVL